MRDRLLLTEARIKEMAQGVRDVAALTEPKPLVRSQFTVTLGTGLPN